MLFGETGATGVGGVVDEDCLSVGLDLRFEVFKVNFPSFFGKQIVMIPFDAQVLANRLAKGESRPSHQDTIATVAQDCHSVVDRSGATEGKEYMVGVDRVIGGSELFGDRFTCGERTRSLSITISHFGVDGLND